MKKCPNCYKENLESALVCEHCGGDFHNGEHEFQSLQKRNRPNRTDWKIGAAASLVLTIFAVEGFYVFHKYDSNLSNLALIALGSFISLWVISSFIVWILRNTSFSNSGVIFLIMLLCFVACLMFMSYIAQNMGSPSP
jgi:hypothetical protein